jgi:hypothetical protein
MRLRSFITNTRITIFIVVRRQSLRIWAHKSFRKVYTAVGKLLYDVFHNKRLGFSHSHDSQSRSLHSFESFGKGRSVDGMYGTWSRGGPYRGTGYNSEGWRVLDIVALGESLYVADIFLTLHVVHIGWDSVIRPIWSINYTYLGTRIWALKHSHLGAFIHLDVHLNG